MTEQRRLKIRDDALCVQCDMHVCESPRVPPDPFTNAADKDALVEWMAANDGRWHAFWLQLKAWMESQGNFPTYNPSGLVARWLLTLPLETITLAAAKALGIGEAEE